VGHSSTSPSCGNKGGQFVSEMPLQPRQQVDIVENGECAAPKAGLDHRPMCRQFFHHHPDMEIGAMVAQSG
jgi:hypothetical protein